MTTDRYEPELGQAVFGTQAWGHYDCPAFVDALLDYILNEIERVYGNNNQASWDRYEDPKIPEIEYRPYYWGACTCGYDDEFTEESKEHDHNPDCPTVLPNFKFEDIELRWYKYSGRGQSVNKDMTEREWREWFDRCLEAILKADSAMEFERGLE